MARYQFAHRPTAYIDQTTGRGVTDAGEPIEAGAHPSLPAVLHVLPPAIRRVFMMGPRPGDSSDGLDTWILDGIMAAGSEWRDEGTHLDDRAPVLRLSRREDGRRVEVYARVSADICAMGGRAGCSWSAPAPSSSPANRGHRSRPRRSLPLRRLSRLAPGAAAMSAPTLHDGGPHAITTTTRGKPMNDDEPTADELETARRLARDPNALYALIDALPDPRAVVARH